MPNLTAKQMLARFPVRMADGGDVTDQQIRDFLATNAGATDAQIAGVMDQYGVTTDRLAAAGGYDPQEVARRYAAATSVAPGSTAAPAGLSSAATSLVPTFAGTSAGLSSTSGTGGLSSTTGSVAPGFTGASEAQKLYYDYLNKTSGQGTPEEILNYAKGLNDYQSLASLASSTGVDYPRTPGYEGLETLTNYYGIPEVSVGQGQYYRQGAFGLNTPTSTLAPTGNLTAANTAAPTGNLTAANLTSDANTTANSTATGQNLDANSGLAPGVSQAYRTALQNGGQQGVNDYYATLRKQGDAYLANASAPTGMDAYNVLVQSGISTSDLRNAGVNSAVLDKIFTVTEAPGQLTATGQIIPGAKLQFNTPTGMTSAYTRSPDLINEAQRLTALGQNGRTALDQQGLNYITELQKGGIDANERAQMLEYATERGYTFDDLKTAGVDP